MNTEPMKEIGYTDIRDVGKESTNVGPSDQRQAPYVTQTRDESVSRAFYLLKVPEVLRKKPNTVRQLLPKSLSGKEALKILKEREEKKKNEEEAKKQRQKRRMTKKVRNKDKKEE
ncbi:hypothetical protein DPMN_101969 [Dreissena polymorpha]|uniref:Uncharacterized protein n=1 Tax=Dreissena polymorpha TaxID=45954 RepID=A0A9D4LIE8_DREPO|nr:hypothetical protein DPMN_101969 [Dreissena polymorpha]